MFRTIGLDLDLFVWRLPLHTAYMPIVCFRLLLQRAITRTEILAKLAVNPNVVLVQKTQSSSVIPLRVSPDELAYAPHRTAVSVSSLSVKEGHELVGMCRQPQADDGLRSSFAAAVWRLDPSMYRDRISLLEAYLGLSA